MSEHGRWKDANSEVSAELREVMRHAQRQVPSAARIEALTASVLAQMPQAAGPHSGAPAASTGIGLSAKLALLGLLVVGSAWWWVAQDEAAPSRRSVVARETALPAPADRPAEQPVAKREPQRDEQPAPLRVERAPSSNRRGASVPEAGASELELLHAARLSRRQDPARALSLLRQHEHRFPRSALGEEREALMIELLRASDPGQGAARLKAFERRYPKSPYRERLRANP